MRKRIKRRRLKKVGIAIAAVMLPFAAGLGAKAAPVFTEMAQKLSNIIQASRNLIFKACSAKKK